MQLLSGKIAAIYMENGVTKANVSIGEAYLRVPLTLLMDVQVGDQILVSSGVAIAKVESHIQKEKEHVSGDSR